MVDCGIYVDGERLPGTFTYAEARAKVSRAAAGRAGSVRLDRPARAHRAADAGRRRRFRAAPAGRRGRGTAPTSGRSWSATTTRCSWFSRPSITSRTSPLVLAREIVETGEIMIFVNGDFVVTVRHGEHGRLARRAQADGFRSRADAAGPVRGDARHRRPCGGPLPRGQRVDGTDIDAIEEVAFAPGHRTEIEPIYLLKREVVELRRSRQPALRCRLRGCRPNTRT